jgi:small subunit ribosomal protein S6
MYIIKTTLGEKELKDVVKNFENILTSNGAKIVSTKDMGQRELAYEIKKQKTGFYLVYEIETKDDKAVKEFDRLALISKDILRHLIIRRDV